MNRVQMKIEVAQAEWNCLAIRLRTLVARKSLKGNNEFASLVLNLDDEYILPFSYLFSQMLLLNVADKIPFLHIFVLAVVFCIGNCPSALPYFLF